jgi:hypothetical protein
MLSCVSGLLLAAISPCHEVRADVSFDDATAGNIIVALERAENLRAQIDLQDKMVRELTGQVSSIRESVAVQKEQSEMAAKVIEEQKKLIDLKDQDCKAQVAAAKPSFVDRLLSHIAAGGVGAVLAVIAVLII